MTISFLCLIEILVHADEGDIKKIQCLVCKTIVDKIEKEIEKISPNRKVVVGQYLIDSKDDASKEKLEYRRSELFLSDVFDAVCESMEEWVKAKYKSNGQLVILPIIINGQMNSLLSEVDVISDSNLNKDIKLHCEIIMEEYEDNILELFRNGENNITIKLCSDAANLCNETLEYEDGYIYGDYSEDLYEDNKDELWLINDTWDVEGQCFFILVF